MGLASYLSTVIYLLPQLIILMNSYLGTSLRLSARPTVSTKGLQSFYSIVALAGLANFIYALYAFTTYYPTCGGGRHGCSFFKDAAINIPSQIIMGDVLILTLISLVYFARESKLHVVAPISLSFSLFPAHIQDG